MPLIALVAGLALGANFEDASADLGPVRVTSFDVGGAGYSGVGVFDYDNDGDLDLYLSNGPTQSNYLLQNDGTGVFTDVAAAAGAQVGTGSGGVLTADLDNDGDTDLVLTGDRSDNVVLANMGDGTFVDVTGFSGLQGSRRNTTAHAADIDNDGLLDVWFSGSSVPSQNYFNTLYMNNGDGTFREEGGARGVGTNIGACSATFTHFDDDPWIDLVIANCQDHLLRDTPFEMYRNLGDGYFEDLYDQSRVWELGHWMGLAFADFDGSGTMDFFSTNTGYTRGKAHGLYLNNGDLTWTDAAPQYGVAEELFGWGTVAPDVDNDGWSDLYWVGVSHTLDHVRSPGLLYMNQADGTFDEGSIPVDLSERWTHGVAHGDLNADGYPDMVVASTDYTDEGAEGIPTYLRNTGGDHHWLTVELRGVSVNLQGVGAIIRAQAGDLDLMRERTAGSSYMSTSTPWPTFGLADETEVQVCVRWPDGVGEDFGTFDADQKVVLVQGVGIGAVPCTHGDTSIYGPGDDTAAPVDTGDPGDTADDTATPDTDLPPIDSGDGGAKDDGGGCGCAAAPAPSTLLWLVPFVVLRRHRPRR